MTPRFCPARLLLAALLALALATQPRAALATDGLPSHELALPTILPASPTPTLAPTLPPTPAPSHAATLPPTLTPTPSPTPSPIPSPSPSPSPTSTPRVMAEKIDPALLQHMAADRSALLPVIVEMAPPRAPFPAAVNERRAREALDLLATYGRPLAALPLISAAAGLAAAPGIESLSASPLVAYVYQDDTVRPRLSAADDAQPPPPGQLSAPYPRVVNADRTWLQGTTGAGVTVAVLDSGIAPDPDLTQPSNRILASVSFAGPRDPAAPDPGGHGTHVAGIVAGNGSRSQGEYVGIAPRANLVDVRVLDRNGTGRLSSVIRGLEWVLAHRAEYNIRVANLSLGAPARRSYRLDPLSAAVQIAWRRGLVVVAAAGNGGPSRGSVESPGIDPYVVTVGATDDAATLPLHDDQLAGFSAWGATPDGGPKPDLVAPGRRIVSLRVPGSALDTRFPDRVVTARNGATYFRLSGTSMATPVVSGVVALLLERQPGLTPDQVKALLTGRTQPYGPNGAPPLPDPSADGTGLADAYATTNAAATGPANRGLRPADTFARALYPVLFGRAPLAWKDPAYRGVDWTRYTWETLPWDATTWDNFAWDGVVWDGVVWDGVVWDGVVWDNTAWSGVVWDGVVWDGMTLD